MKILSAAPKATEKRNPQHNGQTAGTAGQPGQGKRSGECLLSIPGNLTHAPNVKELQKLLEAILCLL